VDSLIAHFGSRLGEEEPVVRVRDRRRFPPQRDDQRPCMAHFYFDDDLDDHFATKLLNPHWASDIAPDLAKLPDLLHMA
jgi:hypothetical protein